MFRLVKHSDENQHVGFEIVKAAIDERLWCIIICSRAERKEPHMKIAVVGLGLIGGSFCKAVKKYTRHTCLGLDVQPETITAALKEGAIDRAIGPEELGEADLTIVCLHPRGIIAFITQYAECFRPGSIVMDTGGVKQTVVDACEPLLHQKSVVFVGGHPMAGREFSGYDYALADLYIGASLILTPSDHVPADALTVITNLGRELQFGKTVCTTPAIHDQTIAYTSQLAHIVSNGYIKSPTLQNESGFSAGSFRDLTRVAKLNEAMWTELFMMNQEALLFELDTLLATLTQYRKVLCEEDAAAMEQLLREGRILKEKNNMDHHIKGNC